MVAIVFVLLVVSLLGAAPLWKHSREYGYGPAGVISVMLVLFLLWLLMRHGTTF